MKAILIGLLLSTTWAFGGGNVGNGGDADVAEFVSIGHALGQMLRFHQGNYPEVDHYKFSAIVRETRVQAEKTTKLRGQEVDGINYPDRKLIKFNRKRWKEMDNALLRKVRVVFHEYLGILRIEENHYRVSSRLNLSHLADLVSKEFSEERRQSLVGMLCGQLNSTHQNSCILKGFERLKQENIIIDLDSHRARWNLTTVQELCALGADPLSRASCLREGIAHVQATIELESSGQPTDVKNSFDIFKENIIECDSPKLEHKDQSECLRSQIALLLLILERPVELKEMKESAWGD